MTQQGHPVPVTVHASQRAKISDGQSVVVAVPATGVVAGLFYLISGWFGAAFTTVTAAEVTAAGAAGRAVALNIEEAEYEATAAQAVTAPAFTAGALIFWDSAASRLTPTAIGNRLVGRVTEVLAGNVPRFKMYDQAHLVTRAAAMANIAAAPTQAEFNNLLLLLRNAGVIAT